MPLLALFGVTLTLHPFALSCMPNRVILKASTPASTDSTAKSVSSCERGPAESNYSLPQPSPSFSIHTVATESGGASHQVHGIRGHALVEHARPGVGLDLGELELGVVGVHGVDLLLGGRAQHLDDLHQLVHPTLACTHH